MGGRQAKGRPAATPHCRAWDGQLDSWPSWVMPGHLSSMGREPHPTLTSEVGDLNVWADFRTENSRMS